MNIKRGILQSFDSSSYTASVLLFEATSYALTGIAVANHIDGTSAINGALCAVLFFNEHNPQDAIDTRNLCQWEQRLSSPSTRAGYICSRLSADQWRQHRSQRQHKL